MVSILLFSFIPNDTSAQTMVNPFEKYDMMFWNTDATMYSVEYEETLLGVDIEYTTSVIPITLI